MATTSNISQSLEPLEIGFTAAAAAGSLKRAQGGGEGSSIAAAAAAAIAADKRKNLGGGSSSNNALVGGHGELVSSACARQQQQEHQQQRQQFERRPLNGAKELKQHEQQQVQTVKVTNNNKERTTQRINSPTTSEDNTAHDDVQEVAVILKKTFEETTKEEEQKEKRLISGRNNKLHERLAKEIKSKLSSHWNNNNNKLKEQEQEKEVENLKSIEKSGSCRRNNKSTAIQSERSTVAAAAAAPQINSTLKVESYHQPADSTQGASEGGTRKGEVPSGNISNKTSSSIRCKGVEESSRRTNTGCSTHALGANSSKRRLLLDALIEGTGRSWLREKTVIVDIKNSRQRCLSTTDNNDEKLNQGANLTGANSAAVSTSEKGEGSGRRIFEKFRQLDDSIEFSSSTGKSEIVTNNSNSLLVSAKKEVKEAQVGEEKQEEEETIGEANSTDNKVSSKLAAKSYSNSKSSSAKQQQHRREEEQLSIKSNQQQQQQQQRELEGERLEEEEKKTGEEERKVREEEEEREEVAEKREPRRRVWRSGQREKSQENSSRQQQHQSRKIRPEAPPTFGTTPHRLVSRLPYFSYYGKARNVELVSSTDRPVPPIQQRGEEEDEDEEERSGSGGDTTPNSSSSSAGGDRTESSADNASKNSLSSTSVVGIRNSKDHRNPPTLTRTSPFGKASGKGIVRVGHATDKQRQQTPQQLNYQSYQVSEIDAEDHRDLELDRFGRSGKSGYSNISNLFPNLPYRSKRHNQGGILSAATTNNTGARLSGAYKHQQHGRLVKPEQYHHTFNSQYNNSSWSHLNQGEDQQVNYDEQVNYNKPKVKSTSLVNLSQQKQQQRSRSATVIKSSAPSESDRAGKDRQSSSVKSNNNNTYRIRNRSMNSLNSASQHQHQQNNDKQNILEKQQNMTSMRRQNQTTTATPTGKKAAAARAGSTAGGYLRGHHRSPSANSLHYGGSTGVSPYGHTPVDPDCEVHGYPRPANLSKSTQHLSGDPDLLYEPQYGTAAPPYYDVRPLPATLKHSGSLYSPTSPNLLGGTSRPGSAYPGISPTGGVGGRNSAGALVNHPNAYYNNTSRFGMYHWPGSAGGRTSLASTNEQLRRILGYQPHTKPIYLHPQWAYSRPFIHLQGTRSTSPNSPLGDMDDEGTSLGPHFEPYNQLQDTQAIRAVDFHPSGEVYAVGSNSRALRICAYPADYELRHFGSQDHVTTAPRILFKFLQVHRGSIYCVSFNSAGQLLATGSNDQTVHIVRYNSVTHNPDGDEYRLTMHDGTVRDLCFIDDATNSSSLLLSAGGGDNKIYVTDCDTITPFQSMAGHTQMIMGLHHWGGANFVSASYDRTIRFWDLRTRACTSIISAPSSYGTGGKWGGPGAPVCSVKVDPTGRLLASGHTDATCMLYDIRGARIIQAFKPHDDEIRTLSFSPKSYYLLTGGYDGRIVLSDLQGDLTQPLPSVCVAENDDKIVQAKWHPSDFTFVSTSADKSATLWAMPTE